MDTNLLIFNIAKIAHILGFVSWFAALFYLVRLFVYHVETNALSEPDRGVLQRQYAVMQTRLYKVIANPAMMITWTAGIIMLVTQERFLKEGWMHVKLTLVLLLTVYHVLCKIRMKKLQEGANTWSSLKLRIWNEVATVFLVAIGALATFQTQANLGYLFGSVALFGALLYLGVTMANKR